MAYRLPKIMLDTPEHSEVVDWNEFTDRTAAVKLVNMLPRVQDGYELAAGHLQHMESEEGVDRGWDRCSSLGLPPILVTSFAFILGVLPLVIAGAGGPKLGRGLFAVLARMPKLNRLLSTGKSKLLKRGTIHRSSNNFTPAVSQT